MKALTVLQPYAHLIALPDSDPRAKRIENRTWPTSYRGPLFIHAGLSRKRLVTPGGISHEEDYGLPVADMAFGAIVAVADLVDCVHVISTADRSCPGPGYFEASYGNRGALWLFRKNVERWPWLVGNEHLEGPTAWVLRDVRRLPEPVPCRGMQGLWGVPPDVAAAVMRQIPAFAPAEPLS